MKKQDIPTQPRPLPDGPLYFVGIGGAGMSAIAYVLAQRGRAIFGSDPGLSAATRTRLESVGVAVYTQHDPAQIGDMTALIVTDAVNEQNPEIKAARERGIPVFRRPEALGAIFNAGRGIAIAGTHGKTTTTGMVASILLQAGLKPTILIGGDLPLIGGNAVNGDPNAPGGDIVLAEACEAYDGFLYLHPEIAVVTNIEADHLDYHGTEEAVFVSFERFIRQVKLEGRAILGYDDAGVWQLVNGRTCEPLILDVAETEGLLWFYSIEEGANLSISDLELSENGYAYTLYYCPDEVGEEIARIQLSVPGLHNVQNSLAAAGVALQLGLPPEPIKAGLEAFTGTGRRFEKLGEVNGVLIVDDYAHHPTEIRATLSAARSIYPERRIIAVFQPHLPSRTRDFLDDFATALTADVVVLTDIYLAREQPIPGVSSEILAEKVKVTHPTRDVRYVPDKNDLPAHLAEIIRPGDLVLTMGAGDIRKAGETLQKQFAQGN